MQYQMMAAEADETIDEGDPEEEGKFPDMEGQFYKRSDSIVEGNEDDSGVPLVNG